jgi:hypothetical protein
VGRRGIGLSRNRKKRWIRERVNDNDILWWMTADLLSFRCLV